MPNNFFTPESRQVFTRCSAVGLFLFLLPQFAIPLNGPYQPPLASAFLASWVLIIIIFNRRLELPEGQAKSFILAVVFFIVYCTISFGHGYLRLLEIGRLKLYLTTGTVDYISVAVARLLQLILVLVTFWMLSCSRKSHWYLMKWWLLGMSVAFAMHGFAYIATSDPLMQRAGVFTEGNQGGLYYLLSIFIALEYHGFRRNWISRLFIALAFFGILLSGSAAAIILTGFVLGFKYVISAKNLKRLFLRLISTSIFLVIISCVLVNYELDFGIFEKLFEEEVTYQSFSRIDRLTSIETAIELFLQSPFFGNGLQTYGFMANDYLSGPLLTFYDGSFRRIPNNIYAEIAAELGIVGMLIFIIVLVKLLRVLQKKKFDNNYNYLSGTISVFMYWLAFPTYSVIFIWAFFGIIFVAFSNKIN